MGRTGCAVVVDGVIGGPVGAGRREASPAPSTGRAGSSLKSWCAGDEASTEREVLGRPAASEVAVTRDSEHERQCPEQPWRHDEGRSASAYRDAPAAGLRDRRLGEPAHAVPGTGASDGEPGRRGTVGTEAQEGREQCVGAGFPARAIVRRHLDERRSLGAQGAQGLHRDGLGEDVRDLDERVVSAVQVRAFVGQHGGELLAVELRLGSARDDDPATSARQAVRERVLGRHPRVPAVGGTLPDQCQSLPLPTS